MLLSQRREEPRHVADDGAAARDPAGLRAQEVAEVARAREGAHRGAEGGGQIGQRRSDRGEGDQLRGAFQARLQPLVAAAVERLHPRQLRRQEQMVTAVTLAAVNSTKVT